MFFLLLVLLKVQTIVSNNIIDVDDILSEDFMPGTILMLENPKESIKNFNDSISDFMTLQNDDGTLPNAMETMGFHRSMMNEYLCRNYVAEEIIHDMTLSRIKRRMGTDPAGVQTRPTKGQENVKNQLLRDEGSSNYKDWLSKSTTLEDIYRHYENGNNRIDTEGEKDDDFNEDYDGHVAGYSFQQQQQQQHQQHQHQTQRNPSKSSHGGGDGGMYYSGGGGGYPYSQGPPQHSGPSSGYPSGGGVSGHGGYPSHQEPEHYMPEGPKIQIIHEESHSSDSKDHDLSELFEIALTALAYLAFKIFVIHVIMCISMAGHSTPTATPMMMPMSMTPTGMTGGGTGTGGGMTGGTGTGGDTMPGTSTGGGDGGTTGTGNGGDGGTTSTGDGGDGGTTGTGDGGASTGEGGDGDTTSTGNGGDGGTPSTGDGGDGGTTGTGDDGDGDTPGTGGGDGETTDTEDGGEGGTTSTGGGSDDTEGGDIDEIGSTGTGAGSNTATGTGTGTGTGTATGTGTGTGGTATATGTGGGRDTLHIRYKREVPPVPNAQNQGLNEMARRVLTTIEAAFVANEDNGNCLRHTLCENNKYSREVNGTHKILIPLWSLGMSWISGRLTKNINPATSMLDSLKASVLGLGKANCELIYQNCDLRLKKQERKRRKKRKTVKL